MNISEGQPESTWQPQPRPKWASALNQVGTILGPPSALVSLQERDLLETARSLTGLDDFGDDAWREPFGILLSDLEYEAELTVIGRLMARHDLLRSLTARLRMAETERLNPEILEQEIESPVFITGMGRTGTSILLELLAQDPGYRTPVGWESRYPSPPPEVASRHDDPRVTDAAADIGFWNQVVPEFLAIHESTSAGPEEDCVGQQHEFTSPVWSALHRVPNYDAWLQGSGMTQAFRFHRRLFQHLQWKDPGRWLFKGPSHTSCLPSLFAEYPDARVIMTHRDPLKVLASTAHMMATLRWQRSDRVDYAEYVQAICLGFPYLLDMVIEQRATGVVPEDRFIDVRYSDLMQDSQATIGSIYAQLGRELTDDVSSRIQCYLAERPKGRHGVNPYRFEHLGFAEDALRPAFKNYMERFDIPVEGS